MPSYLLLLLLLNSIVAVVHSGQSCKKLDDCSCTWGNGTITTLRDLAVKGGVKFTNITDQFDQGSVYSYNPCYPFSNGTQCKDASVCSFYPSGTVIQYGNQKSASFDMEKFSDTDELTLTLTYTNPSPIRRVKVYILCPSKDPVRPFQVLGPLPDKPPLLDAVLSHHSVCARRQLPTTTPQPHASSISVGSVLCIILAVALALYAVGGVIILKFCKKREGLEVLPNYRFWIGLPGCVKDGVKFSISKIRRK